MKSFVKLLRKAVVSGTSAGVISTAALFAGGVRDCRSAMAPVNAISHWLWRDEALRRQEASVHYTASGYLIHHAASIFWAMSFEGLVQHPRMPSNQAVRAIAGAAIVTATAWAVDLYLTPTRFTPGFERRLSAKSLAGVYLAFGVGLMLHGWLSDERRRRCN